MMSGERPRSTLGATLDAIPGVGSGKPGRPRCQPGKLHADKVYDNRCCRRECRESGITPRIARKGMDNSQRLGRYSWVVERTHAWMSRFRRLTMRSDEREEIHFGFVILGCALVCLHQIKRPCKHFRYTWVPLDARALQCKKCFVVDATSHANRPSDPP